MTGLPRAPHDPELVALAEKLGLEGLVVYDRDHGDSPLIHARWRGAPVAISQRTGIAGGFGVAFYAGQVEADWDEDDANTDAGEPEQGADGRSPRMVHDWDEVVDSTWPDPQAAIIMAAALLEARGTQRAERYKHLDLPGMTGNTGDN